MKPNVDFLLFPKSIRQRLSAKVSLPHGFVTTWQKQIQFREVLAAQGEIITENMRLLQRFYYNIYMQIRR
jgi:hypothetical protein